MTVGPIEPDDGQDPDPPDLDLLLHVARLLLYDVAERLEPRDDDEADHDLGLRARALRGVVIRAIQARGGEYG